MGEDEGNKKKPPVEAVETKCRGGRGWDPIVGRGKTGIIKL